jgi:acyl-coenzyme A synthetase/AMP-(fatty) acid ligase
VKRFCRDRIAAFKVPRDVEVVFELPHTEAGKIAKLGLRRAYRSAGEPARE